MKKRVVAMLMAAAMVFGLAACGGTDNKKGDASKAKDDDAVTIWAWDEAFNVKALEVAKEMYAKENPDVKINIVNMAQGDIVTKLNTSLSSGAYDGLPDIVLIEDYKANGYLTSYTDEFSDLSDISNPDDFAPFKTAVNQIDGKTYGVPFDSGVAGTFYRTDLIEQAGYTKEDMQNLTWEKYIEIGKAVKEKTGVAMCSLNPSNMDTLRAMMLTAGAWYTDDEGNVTIADNKALKEAIVIYKELLESGITKQISGWDEYIGAFHKTEVASEVNGCWLAPSIQAAEDQAGKWAIAPAPRLGNVSESVNASAVGGAGWYVLKNAGHEKEAKDFLKSTFASNAELMNRLAEEITLVSTLNAAAESENYQKENAFFGGQKVFQDFAAWMEEVPNVNYGMNTYVIDDLMEEAMQAILNGADIDSTLKDIQAQAEAAIAQ